MAPGHIGIEIDIFHRSPPRTPRRSPRTAYDATLAVVQAA